MFWKKKKTEKGTILAASLLKALGVYFGVIGVRLQLMSYEWLAWDALLFYIAAIFIFSMGRQIYNCNK